MAADPSVQRDNISCYLDRTGNQAKEKERNRPPTRHAVHRSTRYEQTSRVLIAHRSHSTKIFQRVEMAGAKKYSPPFIFTQSLMSKDTVGSICTVWLTVGGLSGIY